MYQSYGAGPGALHSATTAIPALVGIQDNRWAAFDRIWHKNIAAADFHAAVAAIADRRVKLDGRIGGCRIGDHVGFLVHVMTVPPPVRVGSAAGSCPRN